MTRRIRSFAPLAWIISLAWMLCVPAPVQAQAPLAIRGAAVVNVTDGSLRPDKTILIEGNRITVVGDADVVEVPSGATLIDGRGKYLIPGLWDMHVHTVWHDYGGTPYDLDAHLPLFLANGVTGVRDMWGHAAAAQQLRSEIAAGTRVGPRLVVAGNMLDGPRVYWPGATSVTTPERGRFLVDSLATAGADFIKVYMSLSPEVYHAIIDRAQEVDLPVVGHVPPALPARTASEAGQRSMEHLVPFQLDCSSREDELRGVGPLDLSLMRALLESYDPAKCRKLFQTFAENETWQVPTLVIYKRWPTLDPETFVPGEGHWHMPPVQHAAWKEQMEGFPTIPEDWRGLSEEERRLVRRFFFDHKLEMVRLMKEVGVPILAGTDVNGDGRPPFLYAGFSLHEELELLVEAGLTPPEALRAATLEPARYLNATDSLGTVEVGKLADLVLLGANPLENIGNTRQVQAVVADGRLFQKEDLLSLREQVLIDNYRKALEQRQNLRKAGAAPPQLDDGWRTGTAEEEGLDSDRLLEMTKSIRRSEHGNIHALLIERSGKLIYEEYFTGEDETWRQDLGEVTFGRASLHDLRSVSKSIVSTLIGIAINQGTIPSVDAPLHTFLPGYAHLLTGDKRAIRLRHVLSMSAGLRWDEWSLPYEDPENDWQRLTEAEDPVAFVLERELVHEPGSTFTYHGGLTHLLAVILERATGEELEDYARRMLFDPLGIRDVLWWGEIGNLPSADAGLRMRPRDLAKLGSVFLSGGRWNGKQVVPEEWTREVPVPRVGPGYVEPAPDFVEDVGYGYQWWTGRYRDGDQTLEVAMAYGNGQQRVMVVPERALTVTVLAGHYDTSDPAVVWMPDRLLMEYIIDAIVPQ